MFGSPSNDVTVTRTSNEYWGYGCQNVHETISFSCGGSCLWIIKNGPLGHGSIYNFYKRFFSNLLKFRLWLEFKIDAYFRAGMVLFWALGLVLVWWLSWMFGLEGDRLLLNLKQNFCGVGEGICYVHMAWFWASLHIAHVYCIYHMCLDFRCEWVYFACTCHTWKDCGRHVLAKLWL